MIKLLLYLVISGQPHTYMAGPYASVKRCEDSKAEIIAEAKKEATISEYAASCVQIKPTRPVSL